MQLQRLALLVAAAEASLERASPGRELAAKPILGCTTSSFSVPSWFINNFTLSKASNTAVFGLLNRATNQSASFGCANATASATDGEQWSSCSITDAGGKNISLEAVVRVTNDSSSGSLLLSQIWTCDDRNVSKPIQFTAVGTSSVALACSNSSCAAVDSPWLIKGSLLSPMDITPKYADGPIGHAKKGCAAAAKSPSWALQSVYYLNQTGDGGATALASQTLMLQVINHDIGYQAGCVGFLRDDLSTTPTAFNCNGQGFDFIGKDRYRITTQALFEPATFRFTVNQTWYCDDEDPGKPVSVSATGSTVLALNCTSLPIESSSGGKSGNKTTCVSDSDLIVHGEHAGTVTPLPPYSITDPLPTPDGCTVSSVVAPMWTFSGFEIDSADKKTNGSANSTSADVGFNVKFLTGTNEFTYPVSVYQGKADATQPQWHACKFGASEAPMAPFACKFMYDAASKKLTLAADWICSDLDKDHPILFSGTTTTTITKPLSCSTSDGQSQCFTDEDDTWNAPIENVTSRPADKTALAPS